MPFFKYGAKSGKCKPGKIVPSDAALIYALETEPSVWWTMISRPIPSAVVISWQFRQVLSMQRRGSFYFVIRPSAKKGKA